MRARFHRWLARPSTLRELHVRHQRQPHLASQRSLDTVRKRHVATAAVTAAPQEYGDDEETPAPQPTIRKVDDSIHSVIELLGASTHEYGLQMSMRTGVTLLDAHVATRNSFGELRNQANVASDKLLGKLVVDQEEHRENYRLWIELLHFRQRLDGLRGVSDIWRGMRKRHIDLPASGPEAEIIWSEFAHAGSAHGVEAASNTIHAELFEHAKDLKARTGRHYERLHKDLVGRMFRAGHARPAKHYHKALTDAELAPGDALKQVAVDVIQSTHMDAALHAFKGLYNQSRERDIYDLVVIESLRSNGFSYALKWHGMCLKHGDGPSAEVFALPDIQKLFALDKNASLPMKRFGGSSAGVATPGAQPPMHDYAPITRASMSTLVGDVHGIKAKEVSDTFIAKMFATRAFSLDLVIRGLGFFAIDRLGPLSMREMAVRAGSCVDFCNKLGQLRSGDIKLSDHAYCRLIQKIASEGKTDLYNALVASDQHPDTYEETQTQEALLIQFLEAGDWAQAHVTMTGLGLAGVRSEGRAWNRLAQHYLRNRSWRGVEQTVQSMQAQKVPLTSTTITYMHRYLLAERRKGRRPVKSQRHNRPPFSSTDFVTNAYMYTAPLSKNVNYRLWIELLKRYGMQHRWAELEKLVLWLGEQYSVRRYREIEVRRGRRTVVLKKVSPLRVIFSRQMLQALFTWGFRRAAWKSELQPYKPGELQTSHQPWAQGLALLTKLRRYGIHAGRSLIWNSFKTRMWILFGPGHSTKAFNELARQRNELRLADYIKHGNEVWHGRFAPTFRPELFHEDPASEALLMLAFFGRYRKAWNSRRGVQEYVDVAAWADAMLAGRDHSTYRGKTVGQRQRIWVRSPYRVVRPKLDHSSAPALPRSS